MSYCQNQCR